MRAGLIVLVLAGCAVPKEAGFGDVRAAVAERSGHPAVWNQGTAADRLAEEAVRELLQKPLTPEAAVKVALLGNPGLQARYQALGVAQADLVEAGLLENPQIGFGIRFPTRPGLDPQIEAGIGWNFLSLLTMTARKKVASERFEAVKLEVANAVIEHIAEVRKAFIEVQTAERLLAIDGDLAELTLGSFETAQALHESGGITELDLARKQAIYEAARLRLSDTQNDLNDARERLNRALGVWGEATKWRIEAPLPGLPAAEIPLGRLETLAVRQRLDLAAAKRRTAAAARALKMAGDWAWLGDINLGVDFERTEDALSFLGPAGSLELPIFDQGQTEVARLRALLEQSYGEVTDLAVRIRSQVRTLRIDLLTHRRRTEHYRKVLLPLRARIVELAQREYNFMLIGPFDLFDEKQLELEAQRDEVLERAAYWTALADLELALGGKLPPPETAH